MLDVSGSVRSEVRLHLLIQRFAQIIIDIDQILSAAVSDIERLPCCLRGRQTCFQIGFDDIVNIGKVSGLLSVAVDRRNLSVQELADKLRDDRRVGAVRILPSAKHIEIPHTVRIQPVQLLIKFAVLLIHMLGERIRREEIALLSLNLGKHRMISVHGGTGSVDEFLDALLSCGFHHIQRPSDIDLLIQKWHLNTAGHASPSRLIQHEIHALTCFHTRV